MHALTCIMQTGKTKRNKKWLRKVVGKNLKLYCTTLCQRSNGLTSQLLANGIMGEQRQEKDRTMVWETTHNARIATTGQQPRASAWPLLCFPRYYYLIYLYEMKMYFNNLYFLAEVLYTFLQVNANIHIHRTVYVKLLTLQRNHFKNFTK